MSDGKPAADPFSRAIWALMMVFVVGLIGYGVYLIVDRGSRQIGPFLIGIGLIFVPVPIIAVIGALVIIGTGVYCLRVGATLDGIVGVLLGLVTLADRAKEIAAARSAGPKSDP